ncbi:hypothetical protein AB4876_03180 [Zhongshania guokunii]|uniref:Uncharacterized protein n=1 Tax=Zhongshania guokunii TaxID=641783 RepID=A0ABV3U223_9GAMM
MAINSSEGKLVLQANDFARYPNRAFTNYDHYWQFLHRQQQLYLALQTNEVQFIADNGYTISASTQKSRWVNEIPLHFWQTLAAGLFVWSLGASLLIFKPNSASGRYFFLCCGALFSSSLASSIYSSRELAMSAPVLVILCDLKFLADLVFSASLISLLLQFPKRITHYSVNIALFLLALAWFVASEAGILNTPMNRQFAIPIGIFIAIALAFWQLHITTKDPLHKAALFCFFTFISPALLFTFNELSAFPNKLHGLLSIDYTIALMWILFGLALGISRYKLNSCSRHPYLFFILVTTIGLCLNSISYYLKWGQWPVYSPSILLILLLSLIFAIYHASHKLSAQPLSNIDVIHFIAINYQTRNESIDQAWQAFIRKFFDTCRVQARATNCSTATVSHGGKFLYVPLLQGPGSLRCEYAQRGRRLFHPSDAQKINTLANTAKDLITANQQFHRQQQVQNKQLANDLRKNIGEALLPTLRHNEPETIKQIIRDVLAQTHTISSGLYGSSITLHELLTDLHRELEQRLQRGGVILSWTTQLPTIPINLEYPAYSALSACLRELAKLCSQLADISHACIDITHDEPHLVITIRAHNKGVYLPLSDRIQSDTLPLIVDPLLGEMKIDDKLKIKIYFLVSALATNSKPAFINHPLDKNQAS